MFQAECPETFPTADQKRQISDNGGVHPEWRKDGKEVYYLSLDGKMMAVDIREDPKIESSSPRILFDTNLSIDPNKDQYAVSPDGQRFLLLKPLAETRLTPITVILNWTALLKK
jgi:eukaryotic-like serine/threonine-protein kinase